MTRLFPAGKGPEDGKKVDTLSHPRRDAIVLHDAYAAWNALSSFRKEARRNEMYAFGGQLGDMVTFDGKRMTEEQAIMSKGQTPLRFNLIRGTLKSIQGVFAQSHTQPVCYARSKADQKKGDVMTSTLQYNYQLNRTWGLDRSQLNYVTCTGLGLYRISYGLRNGIEDVWVDIPNYNRFFFDNHTEDPRGWDCHLVGMLHDFSVYEVMDKFGHGDRDRYERIRSIYSYVAEHTVSEISSLIGETSVNMEFFSAQDDTRCRVIEVWRKESRERLLVHDRLHGTLERMETECRPLLEAENARRMAEWTAQGVSPENVAARLIDIRDIIDSFWYYYFLSPFGDILDEGETPYWHMSHPFAFKVSTLYNGRVYPFVADYIDSNRLLNRTIMMQDLVSKHAAKGVLMFPEDSKPDDMSMDDIADAWAAYDGIIYYKPKPGTPAPQQIIANSSVTGNYEMINLLLRMFQDTSGIQGALQGQRAPSGTAASLYMQQQQNSQTSLVDLYESFRELREDRDYKVMKTIQQYYDSERFINLGGKDDDEVVYRPKDIQDAELYIRIEEAENTPVATMMNNEVLTHLLEMQAITIEEFLEASHFPFRDRLLAIVKERKQGQGIEVPQDIDEQIRNGMSQGQ